MSREQTLGYTIFVPENHTVTAALVCVIQVVYTVITYTVYSYVHVLHVYIQCTFSAIWCSTVVVLWYRATTKAGCGVLFAHSSTSCSFGRHCTSSANDISWPSKAILSATECWHWLVDYIPPTLAQVPSQWREQLTECLRQTWQLSIRPWCSLVHYYLGF